MLSAHFSPFSISDAIYGGGLKAVGFLSISKVSLRFYIITAGFWEEVLERKGED